MATTKDQIKRIWISGAELRARWGMSESTHRDRKRKGLIPPPEYPFGPHREYYRLTTIEVFERPPMPTTADAEVA